MHILQKTCTTASRQNRRNWAAETGSQLTQGVEIKGFFRKSGNKLSLSWDSWEKMRLQWDTLHFNPWLWWQGTHRINFHSQFSKNIFITIPHSHIALQTTKECFKGSIYILYFTIVNSDQIDVKDTTITLLFLYCKKKTGFHQAFNCNSSIKFDFTLSFSA